MVFMSNKTYYYKLITEGTYWFLNKFYEHMKTCTDNEPLVVSFEEWRQAVAKNILNENYWFELVQSRQSLIRRLTVGALERCGLRIVHRNNCSLGDECCDPKHHFWVIYPISTHSPYCY